MKKIYLNGIETNYSIDKQGTVVSDLSGRVLSQSTQQGYRFVTLQTQNGAKRSRVHRLVAQTYLDNPDNKPYVNHINGCRDDNRLENLEWVTQQENTKHAWDIGLATSNRAKKVKQYNLEGSFIWEYNSLTDAANQTGSLAEKITMCCKRQRNTTNEYQWRYSDDVQDVYKLERPKTLSKKVGQYNGELLIGIYCSFREAANAVNGTPSAISRVCSGVNRTHKGYGWKTVDDIVLEIE